MTRMKTLYIECNMGAAGDMLTAALADLLPDKNAFAETMNSIGIPGLNFGFTDRTLCGICGNHTIVEINGEEETIYDVDADGTERNYGEAHGHEHHHHAHAHGHEHKHTHHHAGIAEVNAIVNALNIPESVKSDVRSVYALIAEAESIIHGTDVEMIHFHELGMMDAICDITAVCLLMHKLSPDRVIVSPVCTGYGEVRCMHGIVPVPSPATAYLIKDIPSYAGHVRAELLTPTGAALLKYYADEFAQRPIMRIEKIGCGMGTKKFDTVNCVRAILGTTEERAYDEIAEISCNIDDMTGEALSYAASVLREAGARDVYFTPIQMKKDRPATMLSCICPIDEEEKFADLILKHTTTWGVRIDHMRRRILQRTFGSVVTEYGTISIKKAEIDGIIKYKPEFESAMQAAKAHNVPIEMIDRAVAKALQ